MPPKKTRKTARKPSRKSPGSSPGKSSAKTRKKRTATGQARLPAELTDGTRGERLHKVLAAAGVASRRHCEKLIADGRVRVNGLHVKASPAWADTRRDRIEVDGKLIRPGSKTTAGKNLIYIALNKPRHVISTARDPQGRKSVMDLVKVPGAKRIFPVGRLDADSTGLILLTNDGELTNHLTHPRYGVPKQYEVVIRGRLTGDDLTRLKKGLYLAHRPRGDKTAGATKATMEAVRLISRRRDDRHGDRTVVSVTLREGQNREIRRMLAQLGYNVRRLQRVAIGSLRLRGLAIGEWRHLTAAERRALAAVGGPGRGSRQGSRPKPP